MILEMVCPSCQGTATRMPVLSDISFADYYHCAACGAVSLTPKDGPGPAVPFKLSASDARLPRNARL